jgi:hypothetical protein
MKGTVMSETKNRKIIQIAVAVTAESGGDIVALCDDGTVWKCDLNSHRWTQVPTKALTG